MSTHEPVSIRAAILRAADHIEKNPQLFQFSRTEIPGDCGTPGCAVGWIAYFHGTGRGKSIAAFCRDAADYFWHDTAPPMPIDTRVFYWRMNALGWSWTVDAHICAKALRLYAEKYHAEERPRTDAQLVASLLSRLVPADAVSEELTW